MKTFVAGGFLLFFVFLNVNAQKLNNTYFEEKVGYDILIDHCNRTGLESPEFGKYFKEYYSEYKVDEKSIAELSNLMDGIKIKVILGTWCHDSKIQVPKFIKVLDQIKFTEKNLEIICVDRSKKTHAFSTDELDIEFVPTFIVYKNGIEIGRIIESPVKSLEKDLLTILN